MPEPHAPDGGDDLTPAEFVGRARAALEHAAADLRALAAVDPEAARALAGRWATQLALDSAGRAGVSARERPLDQGARGPAGRGARRGPLESDVEREAREGDTHDLFLADVRAGFEALREAIDDARADPPPGPEALADEAQASWLHALATVHTLRLISPDDAQALAARWLPDVAQLANVDLPTTGVGGEARPTV